MQQKIGDDFLNWARIKTILIIVFLLVNIFLVYKVSEKYSQKELKPDEISNLKNLLIQNGIVLETTLPSQIKLLPRMKVTNYIVEEKQLADKILGVQKWTLSKDNSSYMNYTSKNEGLKFDGYGFVEYTLNIDKKEAAVLISNENKAKQRIKSILGEYLKMDKYIEDRLEVNKGEFRVSYLYFSGKDEIFNNYISARILSEGKIIIRHGLVDFNGFTSKSKKVSPVDALVELVRVVRGKGKTIIKQISIGYYADLNKGNEIMRSGEADPAWKIVTDKGVYIFDGYTGNFETAF